MTSWMCWIHLAVLFRNTWANLASSPHYTIHRAQLSFEQAAEDCSPGVLTTLATQSEVTDILGLISQSADQGEFTFWVGLRKVKNECVVPTLPLRGFKWMEDGSEDSQVSRWTQEPKYTCTTVRCAALKGEWDGSGVTRWGLVPVTCKNSYQFICKLKDRETGVEPKAPELPKPSAPEPPIPAAPEPPKPAKPEPRPATQKPEPPKTAAPEPPKPAKPEPRPATQKPEPPKTAAPEPPKPAKPEPRPATQKPESANPGVELPSQAPKPKTDLKPENEPELQAPNPNPGLDSCQRPLILSARSISFDNSSRIQVECWSTEPVELRCSGRPAVWRLLDDSPVNFTTVCLPCENGFRKDVSGNCVDVDECGGSSPPCRHTCLNTEGSYSCFCSDENGKQHDEDSSSCADTTTSGILIPVLAALAALAVLLVVVAVTVKCCLMRQSKKQARKEADKMAMKSHDDRDSFEAANEKSS
ncbi:C-type lectin domain family 14 member A [Clinocottus analis]|uniref:C-type lectin domain family 14 member A n=1 Tax=Clinocottus analis TaxID=304258 RepID=UPI0035C089C0